MAIFTPKTFPEIFGSMVNTLLAVTPLSDVNFGSVWTTMLEAAAQEDDEQYFQMLEIIRNFSLDTTSGDDLDNRAFEYGITRLTAFAASTTVTFGDSAFEKVSTGVYSGLAGAAAGSTSINGDSDDDFPTTGSIIIGRGTPNVETIAYTSITVNPNYVVFNLGAALAFDHGTDETIVLAQGGARLITPGALVFVPAGDLSEQINFTTDASATILDGEVEVTGIPVTAIVPGIASNVPIGAINQFGSFPFPTATVRNTFRVTNGRDEESDQELRDRIKETIQSLSRGTGRSIISSVIGVVSETENKRVVSAALIEPTTPANVVKLFIDDGTGFVPAFTNVGFETVVASATGGEKFLKIANVPVVKAFVETQSSAPFTLAGTETLFVDVGGEVETIVFESTDFDIPGQASAQEVLERFNQNATLFEARISSDGSKVRIFSRSDSNEEITVTGGTANTALGFPTDTKFTAKLFRKRGNDIALLTKDGRTASAEAGNTVAYDFSTLTSLVLTVDGKLAQNVWIRPADFITPASVDAEEISAVLNEQISGAICSSSSNDTRVKLVSNLDRTLDSKVRIIENFDQVWSEEAGVLVDRTTEAQSGASNVPLFGANLDYIYLGHTDVQFPNVFIRLVTPASTSILPLFEYWNGSAWMPFGVVDGTDGFQSDGNISFAPPNDWAQTTVNGSVSRYWIRIQRTEAVVGTAPTESRIRVCGANEELGFSEVEEVGDDKDYTLNRFIGQIELEEPLAPGDIVTLGSFETRARIVTGSTANYGLAGGELLEIIVDGILQSYTFVAGDFFTPGAALASEVAIAINANFTGLTASTIGGNKVLVEVNKLNGGSLQVNVTAANTILQFPTTLQTGFVSHIPALESGNAEPYVFLLDNSVIVIIDGNAANNFNVPCHREGTLTTVTTPSDFRDSTLTPIFALADEIAGFDVINKTRKAVAIQDITYVTTEANPVTVQYIAGTSPVAEVTNVTVVGGAVAEVTDITTVADVAGSLNNKYFPIDAPGTGYYVWYNVGGAGVDPAIGGRTGIQVAIAVNATAPAVASATRAAMDALADFITTNAGNVVTNTNATAGSVVDAVDGGAPTGFGFAITTQGTNTTLGGKHFNINSPSVPYYVWFDTGASIDPAPVGRTGIQVVILPTDTSAQIATAAQVILQAHAAFNATVLSTVITVTNAATGAATDATAQTSGFTILVVTQGAGFITGITVLGNAITIKIESGVTTATQVKALFDGEPAATALGTATITGVGATAQVLVGVTTLVVQRRVVATYTVATGRITTVTPFPFTPVVGDTYQVLPSTAQEVALLWNNINISLLSTQSAITASSGGTKVQIESLDVGEDASVQVTGGTGNVVLAFPTTAKYGVDGYRYFIGLAQLAQKTVDGDPLDEENFPGFRAAGVQVEVIEPVAKPQEISITVTPREGVTLGSITGDVKSAISAYINGLTVGQDVILSAIVCSVRSVSGVFDARITSPAANVAIADSELARVNEADITVG